MTLKVRDEADILEQNLRFHLAQGVDFFVVTDNRSVDATPEILRRYERLGLLTFAQKDTDTYLDDHTSWVTAMARRAATEFGADWVINNDADEFWWPVSGTVREAFAAIPDRYEVLQAPRPEFAPRPDGPGSFLDRLLHRDARSRVALKVAHRGLPDVVVGGGSHRVRLAGQGTRHVRQAARTMLRAVAPVEDSDAAQRLVPAPRWPIRVLHYPVRSYGHFRRRVELELFHGGRKIEGPLEELMRAHREERLADLYAGLALTDDQVAAAVREGALVEDLSLRDFLAGCPDPLEEDGLEAARRWAEDRARRVAQDTDTDTDLADNAFDMMQTLARMQASIRRDRSLSDRRADDLEAECRRLAERVRELEGTLDGRTPATDGMRSRPGVRARLADALRRR
jgi:hypothetical protein